MHKIPTISYNDLINADKEVLEFLSFTLENNGFFVVNNHPIDLKLIANAFNIAEKMFNLPFNTKKKYHIPGTNGARGYTPYGIETALNQKVADQKEFWHQGSTSNTKLMSNIYVDEIDNFKDLDSLYKEFEKVGVEILKSFATFKVPYNTNISDSAQNGNSILRLIHYPPTDGSNKHRARAHNDVNLITLLIGGNEAGLEAQDKKGDWVECNCNENEIICNIGDMLELISNNKLNSTPHRVVSKGNQSKSRYSIPFFLHPRPEVFLNSEETLTADQFLTKRLQDIKLN